MKSISFLMWHILAIYLFTLFTLFIYFHYFSVVLHIFYLFSCDDLLACDDESILRSFFILFLNNLLFLDI